MTQRSRGELLKSSARLCDLEYQCDEIYVIRAHPRWAPCGESRIDSTTWAVPLTT